MNIFFIIFLCIFTLTEQATKLKCPADEVVQYGCPIGWTSNNEDCYLTVTYPLTDYMKAKQYCLNSGAMLIRIRNSDEHAFISNLLDTNAVNKSTFWYTSGMMNSAKFGQFIWDGYGSDQILTKEMLQLFNNTLPDPARPESWDIEVKQVVMGYYGSQWKFFVVKDSELLYFVCQGSKNSVNQVASFRRLEDYGQTDIRNVERAPCITKNPENVLYLPKVISKTSVMFNCEAIGNPTPIIKWYFIKQVANGISRELIDPLQYKNGQISQTGGILIIHNPNSDFVHKIECEAANRYGITVSNQANIILGSLGTYQSGAKSLIRMQLNKGFLLDCEAPQHSPDDSLVYSFYYRKGDNPDQAIQDDLRNNIFLSRNLGLIGFSVATRRDSGVYKCMITFKDIQVSGTSYTSPDMPLEVYAANVLYPKPEVNQEFPNYRPKEPLIGQTVRFECFGYGEIKENKLNYFWKWNSGAVPKKAVISDKDRVLSIPNIQIEDKGVYSCYIVTSDGRKSDERSVTLEVYMKPTFVNRPKNQYVDVGSNVSIPCIGIGNPKISLKWYRNNELLQTWLDKNPTMKSKYNFTEGDISVSELKIDKISSTDNGLFGCVLHNKYGTNAGYFELKAFLFAPTFGKYPLLNMEAMIGGRVVLACRVEGAPQPTIKWKFNGGDLSVDKMVIRSDLCDANFCQLPNNNLVVNKISATSSGNYTCVATNSVGVAESTSRIDVVETLKIGLKPIGRRVKVNTNVALPCQATSSPYLDIDYDWYFENVRIRFDRMDLDARRFDLSQFSRSYQRYFGSMTISNIQFYDEGQYTCRITTPIETIAEHALIKVLGPPGECGAIKIIETTNNSHYVQWTDGDTHGREILSYNLEVAKADNNMTWIHLISVNQSQVSKVDTPSKMLQRKQFEFSGLPANIPFRLRIVAANEFGVGVPSPFSEIFTPKPKPPTKAPTNITGGGGKMRSLVIRWEKLLEVEQNGDDFTYEVQYKEGKELEWSHAKDLLIRDLKNGSFVDLYRQTTITLPEDRYNTPYNVQVRAVNKEGPGPWSVTGNISSAPSLMKFAPANVEANSYNSTAIQVVWDAPEVKPENGKITGYHIVYWVKNHDCKLAQAQEDRLRTSQRLSLFNLTKLTGIIIGLEVDTYYCIGVQGINDAGDGPESSFFDQTTFKKAPQNFPTMVYLNSTGVAHQVRVSWNGVRVNPDEESVDGYTIRYWESGGPVRSALDVNVGMKVTGEINGIQYDVRYNVRVFGHSRGGHGKLSNPMEQFMLVPKNKCVSDQVFEGPDVRYVFICSSCIQAISKLLIAVSIFGTILYTF